MKKIWIAIIVIFCFYFFRSFIALDPDFGWQLATGQFILKHGISQPDPFSYTMPSYPFINHEWLADVMIALFYPLIGILGLSILFALFAIIAFTIQIVSLPRKMQSFVLIPLLFVSAILLSTSGIRMQVITWVFFSLFLWILNNPQYNKWRLFLPLIFLLWANLHGGFTLGIIYFLIFILLKGLEEKSLRPTDFAILVLSILITFVNPYGFNIWSIVLNNITSSSNHLAITEWLPLWNYPFEVFLWFFLGLSINLLIRYWKSFSSFQRLLFVLSLLLGISSVRHLAFWLLISLPMVGQALSYLSQEVKTNPYNRRMFRVASIILLIVVGIAILTEVTISNIQTVHQSENMFYPKQAVDYLEHHPSHGQIFSQFEWGGYLDWKLPEKKVFIDGRMTIWNWHAPNGSEENNVFQTYLDFLSGKISFKKLAQKYNIDTVLISRKYPVRERQFQQYGMKIIYKDNVAVIYRK